MSNLPPPSQSVYFNDAERERARHNYEAAQVAAAEEFERNLEAELRSSFPGNDRDFKRLFPQLRDARLIELTQQRIAQKRHDRINMLASALDNGSTPDPRDLGTDASDKEGMK